MICVDQLSRWLGYRTLNSYGNPFIVLTNTVALWMRVATATPGVSSEYKVDIIKTLGFKCIRRKGLCIKYWPILSSLADTCFRLGSNTLQYNDPDDVLNHHRPDCLLRRSFWCRSKKIPKFCVTGLHERNPPVTSGSPHKGSLMRKIFPFDDVIMWCTLSSLSHHCDLFEDWVSVG